jgi:hypothetical protein
MEIGIGKCCRGCGRTSVRERGAKQYQALLSGLSSHPGQYVDCVLIFEEDFEMAWKPVKDHFRGGTDAAMVLKGKKVRAIKAMSFSTSYLGEGMGAGPAVDVKVGTVAVVGSVPPKHLDHLLSIEWIEATGFQPVRFSERMRGLPDFEAARRVKLQNPGDPS